MTESDQNAVDLTSTSHVDARASAFAQEVSMLPQRVRSDLGAGDGVLVVFDAVVMLAKSFLDPEDDRHWSAKLGAVLETFQEVGKVYGPQIADWAVDLDEAALEALVKKYSRQGYLSYVRRMIGEAAYRRLHVAATEDIDTVAAATHRAVEGLLPYAVALEDVADVLTEEQVRAFMDFNPAGGFMVELVFKTFELLDSAVDRLTLPEHLDAMKRARSAAPDAADLVELTRDLRERVSGQSRALIKDVNAVLDRKLRGARDALAFSADSNSQAANSLVEFIDRLMRLTYSEPEVLAWLESNYPGSADLTYVHAPSDKVRPTKRGQALCLVHGCAPVQEPSQLHMLMATSISAIRQKLGSSRVSVGCEGVVHGRTPFLVSTFGLFEGIETRGERGALVQGVPRQGVGRISLA